MKNLILFGSIGLACGLLLTSVLNSMIDAKSWSSDVPNSIATARDYFKAVNPGNFYRVFSPINQILALLVLILFWKFSPSIRLYMGVALLMYILCDVLTFTYFYPRNDILFRTAQLTDVDLLKRTVTEWSQMNWARVSMLLVGIILSFLSLHNIYSLYRK